MTLTHLFKAQAIFAWIWVAMFWFLLDIPAETLGWSLTENPNIQSFAQATSVPILAIGIISWMAPTWVGSEHIKKVGMLLGVYINILFVAVQLFHISTGAANLDPFGMFATSVFIILFFWKCRPTS
tara:strand:+ start:65 stop:442 length:378 start_codon:yes stop_codon:yes gene_type:complete